MLVHAALCWQMNVWNAQRCQPCVSHVTLGSVQLRVISECYKEGRKEGNVLFNDTLNTFYLRLYGVRHMVTDHSDSERGNPLLPHGLLFPVSSKGSLYASSHRHNTYHSLCYTSHGALAGTRNSSMGPPWRIDPMTHRTMSEHSYHRATSRSSEL